MTDMERAILLYRRMADRLEKSGRAPRQARVYRETIEFMADCQSLEEAMDKIRKSPLFLAPGAALVQDKLAALGTAAQEMGMPDLAQVYQDKIQAIDEDIAALYETGYETRARNLKIPYLTSLEAWTKIYQAYLTLTSRSALDQTGIKEGQKELQEALGQLQKPSDRWQDLAHLPAFRAMVPAQDSGYQAFLQALPQLINQGPDYQGESQAIENLYQETLAQLSQEAQAVMAVGRANQAKVRRAQALAKAPSSKTGSYQFSEEEVKGFE